MVPTTTKEVPTESVPMFLDNPPQTVTNPFPQAGGIRITEATKVILDPTAGAESIEISLRIDYLTSNSPPGETG